MKVFREPLLIFPEGGRNRYMTIQPQEAHYGVGKIIQEVQKCRVLVIYFRESEQVTFSDYPRKNGIFYLSLKEFEPKVKQNGLAEKKKITLQIMQHLQELEKEYFHYNPELKHKIQKTQKKKENTPKIKTNLTLFNE